MIRSMTGFGKAVSEIRDKKLVVEVRTLNSRQLDLNARICRFFRDKESEIRSLATKTVERGKADLSVYFENTGTDTGSGINRDIFLRYYNELVDLGKEVGSGAATNYFSLALNMPDVLTTSSEEVSEDDQHVLIATLANALEQMNEFRAQEGTILANDISGRINIIIQLLTEIKPFEQERIETIREKIARNMETFVDKEHVDNVRFEQELFYYIEKLDITEEKVRLAKHCDYFLNTMLNEESTGRKLGFIAQEIGREINTIGSKSNHAEIQKIVVMMKDELEKIKEQLLNIL
jgi:uncharacterized protein (TIGR00255 family)